jgi:CxxC-x17-CxxC domain-containing protein
MLTDMVLVCRDCGQEFVFTAGEQEQFASRGLYNAPSRCPACRAARRVARGDSGSPSVGGPSGGGGFSGGGGARQMHTAVCSNCGREARVPFVPRGDKPVYCSDCFGQMRGGGYR